MRAVITACPGCAAAGTAPLRDAADGRFALVRCAGCRLVRVAEIPEDPRELAAYYQEEYYSGPRASRLSLGGDGLMDLYRRRLARQLAARAGKPGRALEVGCGRGTLLAALRDAGWEVHGTQVSATAAAYAREQLRLPIFLGDLADAPYEPASFDRLLLLHVLEHVPDPRTMLARLRRLARPGGRLLVETPNFGGLGARLFGSRWLGEDLPRHLFHFEPRTLDRLLRETGWEPRRISTWSAQYGPFFWAQGFVDVLLGSHQRAFRSLCRPGKRGLIDWGHIFALGALFPAGTAGAAGAALLGRGDVLQIEASTV